MIEDLPKHIGGGESQPERIEDQSLEQKRRMIHGSAQKSHGGGLAVGP
jgi:hypothetical protein